MIYDLVKKSRSFRGYDRSRIVTENELVELVECARLCPSTCNIQPLKYYISWEEDEVSRIQPLTAWARNLPGIKLPHPGMEPAAFIIICQDTDISANLSRFSRDIGITAQTMLLAACEKGLGGCMIGSFSPEKISGELALPENIIPMLVVALGLPAEETVLTEVGEDGKTAYYRDAEDVHYVPKRRLEDIILTREHQK